MRIILCYLCFLAVFKLDAQDSRPVSKPGCCYVKLYCEPLVDTVKAKYPVYLGAERSLHKHVDIVKFTYIKEEKDSVKVAAPSNVIGVDSMWCFQTVQEEVFEQLPIVILVTLFKLLLFHI